MGKTQWKLFKCIGNKHFLYLFIEVHCITNSIPTDYKLRQPSSYLFIIQIKQTYQTNSWQPMVS